MQIEIMPQPPERCNPDTPWPMYPRVLKTSSSHEEGCLRRWNLETKRFVGRDGRVVGVEVERVEWEKDADGRWQMRRTGETETIEADLVLLAMGFVHPVHEGLVTELDLSLDDRKNVRGDDTQRTSHDKVFVAGDALTGASLVVRAIASGRRAAEHIDRFLRNG